MNAYRLENLQHTPQPDWAEKMRWECQRCGVHTPTHRFFTLGGKCGNCGSYDLCRLEAPQPDSGPVANAIGARDGPG